MQVSKSLFVLCIFGLLALPLVGVASAQNMLPNGLFETGDLTGWQVFGATVTVESTDNGPSFGGTHHALVDNQSPAANLTIKASTDAGTGTAGTVYYSFDLSLVQADAGGVVFVEVFAEQAGGGVVAGSGLLDGLWPWNGWEFYSGSFEAPATTDYLTIQISAVTGADPASNCLLKVDNVYLSQTGPPVATEEMSMGSIKALYR